MFAGFQALFVHCALALASMFAAAFVGLAATGPSVSAAERAVMVIGVLDLVIAVVAVARFAAATAAFSSGIGRVAWTVVCIGLLAVGTTGMFLVTVMTFNR